MSIGRRLASVAMVAVFAIMAFVMLAGFMSTPTPVSAQESMNATIFDGPFTTNYGIVEPQTDWLAPALASTEWTATATGSQVDGTFYDAFTTIVDAPDTQHLLVHGWRGSTERDNGLAYRFGILGLVPTPGPWTRD